MPKHGQLSSDDEVHAGGKEALKGALNGAATVRSTSPPDSFSPALKSRNTVGYPLPVRRGRCVRRMATLSQLDFPVQGLYSNVRHDYRQYDRSR